MDELTVVRTPGKNISRLPRILTHMSEDTQRLQDRSSDDSKLTPMAYNVDHLPDMLHSAGM